MVWWGGKPGCGKNFGNVISERKVLSIVFFFLSGSDRPPFLKRKGIISFAILFAVFKITHGKSIVIPGELGDRPLPLPSLPRMQL